MELSGYRAWVYDSDLKEYAMKEVAKLDFYLDACEVSMVHTLATVQRSPFDFTYDTHSIEDVILMKDTGLKDKAGKHIYTRDILQLPDCRSGVVYWDKLQARYAVEIVGDVPKDLTKAFAEKCIVEGNTIETADAEDILEENSWD